jgi:hypothetical protein
MSFKPVLGCCECCLPSVHCCCAALYLQVIKMRAAPTSARTAGVWTTLVDLAGSNAQHQPCLNVAWSTSGLARSWALMLLGEQAEASRTAALAGSELASSCSSSTAAI